MTEKIDIKRWTGGRFREYDRDQIALDLLEWVQKEDSLNLCAFSCDNMIPPNKITLWAREDAFFKDVFLLAKCFLNIRREKSALNGEMYLKAYDMNIPHFDHFLDRHNKDELDYEYDLKIKLAEAVDAMKKEIKETVSAEVKEQFDSLMNQITRMQDKK